MACHHFRGLIWLWRPCNGDDSKSFSDILYIFKYRTRAIITLGLYIFYPILKTIFFSRRFLQKILSLCVVNIQERFVIKSRL